MNLFGSEWRPGRVLIKKERGVGRIPIISGKNVLQAKIKQKSTLLRGKAYFYEDIRPILTVIKMDGIL